MTGRSNRAQVYKNTVWLTGRLPTSATVLRSAVRRALITAHVDAVMIGNLTANASAQSHAEPGDLCAAVCMTWCRPTSESAE